MIFLLFSVDYELYIPLSYGCYLFFFLTQNFIIFCNGTRRGLQKPAENGNISGNNSPKKGENNNEVG